MSWPVLKRDVVAILRGLDPSRAVEFAMELVAAGFEAIEVPLNSPDPFRSIRSIVDAVPRGILVGAGTVLTEGQVDALLDAGARLVVSPNANHAVIAKAAASGMVVLPGVLTPTEALAALVSGASALKFFPANVLGPDGIAAIRTILPHRAVIGAVGGIGHDNLTAFADAGVRIFGFGSNLFRPTFSPGEVGATARRIVAAYDQCVGRDSR